MVGKIYGHTFRTGAAMGKTSTTGKTAKKCRKALGCGRMGCVQTQRDKSLGKNARLATFVLNAIVVAAVVHDQIIKTKQNKEDDVRTRLVATHEEEKEEMRTQK
jgi:hypothetical protein